MEALHGQLRAPTVLGRRRVPPVHEVKRYGRPPSMSHRALDTGPLSRLRLARQRSLTTGEEVTSVTWAAACALCILWLVCPPPGASRDATPRLGRAVVTDQWEVDKAEYWRHRRSVDNDFRQTAPATGSSPDNKPDICEYLRLMLFQNHYGSGGLRATWRPLLRVVTSVDKAT